VDEDDADDVDDDRGIFIGLMILGDHSGQFIVVVLMMMMIVMIEMTIVMTVMIM
jgi:hypothetical protein